MTKEEWASLKEGDIIFMKNPYNPRKILKVNGGCITLEKVRGSGTTVYTSGDKKQFTIKHNKFMAQPKLFQYAILWHPTEKQVKEEGLKSQILVQIKTILATDQSAITMAASMEIPVEKRNELDQIQIVIRPF